MESNSNLIRTINKDKLIKLYQEISKKETKLPPIQSNLQKGSLKQPKEKSNSNAKNQKTNSNSSNNQKMPNIPLTNRNIPENLNQLSDKNKNEILNNLLKKFIRSKTN